MATIRHFNLIVTYNTIQATRLLHLEREERGVSDIFLGK